MNDDLAEAIALIDSSLKLRMYGDISHMPMTQAEWDERAEAFLRRVSDDSETVEGTKVEEDEKSEFGMTINIRFL